MNLFVFVAVFLPAMALMKAYFWRRLLSILNHGIGHKGCGFSVVMG